jgi:hypothetical protein
VASVKQVIGCAHVLAYVCGQQEQQVVIAEKQGENHLQLLLFKLPFLIRLLDTWMLVYKKLPGAQGGGRRRGLKGLLTGTNYLGGRICASQS